LLACIGYYASEAGAASDGFGELGDSMLACLWPILIRRILANLGTSTVSLESLRPGHILTLKPTFCARQFRHETGLRT